MRMTRTRYSTFRYLPVAVADMAWGLYVTGSGVADIPPGAPYPPPVHPKGYAFDWHHGRVLDEFQVLYITRGRGSFESRGSGRQAVPEGSALLLFPGVWHRYMPDRDTGWKEYWISFRGRLPDMLREHREISPENAVLKIGLHKRVITLYNEVLELIELEKVGYKTLIAANTYHILAEITALQKQRQYGSEEVADVVQRAQIYLIENLRQPVNFERLASELGVGYSWFRRRFKEYTGLSLAQYFIQLRLNKAKELLSGTSFPMQEIADATGFQSQYYFSRLFSEKIGVTPTQWRKFSRGEVREA